MSDWDIAEYLDFILEDAQVQVRVSGDAQVQIEIAHLRRALIMNFGERTARLRTLRMLNEIGHVSKVPEFIKKVKSGEANTRLMGFGHRVYKHVEDPRATHLRQMSRDLGQRSGEEGWFKMSERIEALMRGLKEVSDNIAHDLKTPLTRLKNRCEQALRTVIGPMIISSFNRSALGNSATCGMR